MGKDPDQIRQEIEDTRDRMGDTVDAIAYKADVPSRVKESIADKVDGVKSAIGNTATKIGSVVTGTTSKVSDSVGDALPDGSQAVRSAKRAVGMVKENPLGLLLSGVAIGFLVGSLLPSTDIEDEKLGRMSDNLKEQVKDAGSQALEHGKAVVKETMQSAQDTAQKSMQDHGQQLADDTRDQFSASLHAQPQDAGSQAPYRAEDPRFTP